MKGSAFFRCGKVVLEDTGFCAGCGPPTSLNDVKRDVFIWGARALRREWGDADG